MRHDPNSVAFEAPRGIAYKAHTDQAIVEELVRVLSPHPNGRRRWAVMRAIRDGRERSSQDIPLKFEDEIERVFRRFCADYGDGKSVRRATGQTLFRRPRDRGGEVWALDTENLKTWLADNALDFG